MKNILFIIIISFLVGCREKKEIPLKYNSQDLDLEERFRFTTDFMLKNDKKIFKMDSIYDYTKNNKILIENLWKEKFFEEKILIPENFKGNTTSRKAYSIDENSKIVFLYEASDQFLTFKIQRNKENYETSHKYQTHFHGLILKDLDDDGLKEIIILSDSNSEDFTYYEINVYSVFK